MNNKPFFNIKKLGLSAMFIAIGLILPFFTGQIPKFGNMLLPMHIPVFICAFICDWRYGMAVGLILPQMRSVIFGMPVFYPTAIAMSAELATYGLVTGLIYGKSGQKGISNIYISMVVAMIAGRALWGISEVILLGITGNAFTFQMFIAGAFLNAVPGIILQLVLVPAVVIRIKPAVGV